MKQLRGAIIGYGFISGKGHVPAYLERANLLDDVKITALADICPARRDFAKTKLPEAKIYSDYKTLLAEEAKNLDFVDISVPPSDHAKIASLALEHNLHVLCEKPLTISCEEAQNLLKQAGQAKRVIFPCHNYKHAPVVKAIAEIIASGRIGPVRSVTLNTFRNTHAKGVIEWEADWRRQKKWSGGGIAMDHGSHSFYLAANWMGSYPTSVTAKMSNLEPEKYDTEDNFNCTITFPTGVANVHLTWTAGVRKVIYAIQGALGAITVHDDDIEVATIDKTLGEDGAQRAIQWNLEKTKISSHWMDASHVSWFNSMFDEFKDCIAKQQFVGAAAKEALMCVELINAAYRSAKNSCREESIDQGVFNARN
jgi:predicted dehydrogenase